MPSRYQKKQLLMGTAFALIAFSIYYFDPLGDFSKKEIKNNKRTETTVSKATTVKKDGKQKKVPQKAKASKNVQKPVSKKTTLSKVKLKVVDKDKHEVAVAALMKGIKKTRLYKELNKEQRTLLFNTKAEALNGTFKAIATNKLRKLYQLAKNDDRRYGNKTKYNFSAMDRRMLQIRKNKQENKAAFLKALRAKFNPLQIRRANAKQKLHTF